MQNWDSLQPANYELNWYSNMFSGKNDTHSSASSIDQCFNMKQTSTLDVVSSTPSPKNTDANYNQDTNYLDNNAIISNTQHPLGFNPLTPPGLPNAVLPSVNFQSGINHGLQRHESDAKIDENSLTPRNTPPVDVTPPKSPKTFNNNETSDRDNDIVSNSSEDTRFIESEDDELIRVPIYNSHGKMKNYKCKHCGFLAITKVAFWNHSREHMKPEKMLQCPKCPFVTELKHHLEYHIRKHKNLKPFQCDKCNYSCVNKSMLNSHLKSHSSVYQYRCSDCDYATKYCHSFKLHLRKYDHKPGMVLDEDGTPNPSVVIDVYGTRRGPKMKSGKSRSKSDMKRERAREREIDFESKSFLSTEKNANQNSSATTNNSNSSTPKVQNGKNVTNTMSSLLPNNLANMLHQSRNMPFLPYFNLNLQMIAAQQHAAWTQMSPQIQQSIFNSCSSDNEMNTSKDKELKVFSDDEDNHQEQKRDAVNDAMDLSQTTLIKADVLIHSETQSRQYTAKDEQNTPTITSSSSKRKSRLLRMDHEEVPTDNSSEENQKKVTNSMEHDGNDDENDDKRSRTCSMSESKTELPSSSQDDIKFENPNVNHRKTECNTSSQITSQIPGVFECKYCDIYFKDAVLYTIHMGYHSCDDVFKCNMCGEKCDGPVGLFIHMARNAHS